MNNTNNNSNRITTHHSTDRSWAIHHGDVNKVLPTLPPVTFDGVFFDPPYGLKFMGEEWDESLPPASVLEGLLRLCKPGAYLLAFGHPRTFHRFVCNIEDAGWEIRDTLCWLYGDGFPKGKNIGQTLGERWDDYHTLLKPAWEPIILAMKPVDGTFVKNATNHGCGGLNIGDCRIGTTCSTKPSHQAPYPRLADGTKKGRHPANLILDEQAAVLLDEQYGTSRSSRSRRRKAGSDVGNGKTLNAFRSRMDVVEGYDDEGGASRFFYCAKANRKERKENSHPTVKPLALCEYLARLILQPEREAPRRLLVPYSGSGSEMVGALSAGWDHVTGIEKDDQFVATARRRLLEHKDEYSRPA